MRGVAPLSSTTMLSFVCDINFSFLPRTSPFSRYVFVVLHVGDVLAKFLTHSRFFIATSVITRKYVFLFEIVRLNRNSDNYLAYIAITFSRRHLLIILQLMLLL